MATYELKNNGKDLKSSADVRVGDLKDMEEDDDYYTYAYVAKPDDSDDPAELVYIVKQEKSEYKAISLTVDGTAVSAAAGHPEGWRDLLLHLHRPRWQADRHRGRHRRR